MQKINYNNNVYYYSKGALFDETFIQVPKAISDEVLAFYYSEIDYKTFNKEEILSFIKELKEGQFYNKCIKVIEYVLDEYFFVVDLCWAVVPMLTSCYRLIAQPEKAINIWEEYKGKYGLFKNVALMTSVAAAYCDIKDFDTALKFANMAYAAQRGGTGHENELSLVYKRIEAEIKGPF